MSLNSNILNELTELKSKLAEVETVNPYTVPTDYFDNLISQISTRIKELESNPVQSELKSLSSVLSNILKNTPYSVPNDYFVNLPEKMLAIANQTAKEELEILSPFLSGLKKENPYAVPTGFFEVVNTPVVETIKPVVKIKSIYGHKWLRLAAAAVLIGFIAFGSIQFFSGTKAIKGDAIAGVKKDIKNLSDDQKDNLIEFLDTGMDGKETTALSNDAKTKEVKQLLQDVSDEELSDFQQQTEDMGDILMTN